MAKDRDDELNKGVPGGDEFSLESILAEFGGGQKKKKVDEDTIPFPVIPQSQRQSAAGKKPGRVLTFPEGGSDEIRPRPARPPAEPAPEPPPKPAPPDNVLDFPEEAMGQDESPLTQGINRLLQKADDYAEHMFEEEDLENDTAVRRAEEFIPGTDEEEPPPRRRERKPRREPPPAPDLPPADLARRYSRGLKGLKVRSVLVFLLFLPALYLTLDVFPYPVMLTPQLRVLALAGVQVIAMLLGLDVLFRGLFGLFRLDVGMDTVLFFASAVTLADALTLYQLDPREGQMPYCAAIVLGICLLLQGTYRKRRGPAAGLPDGCGRLPPLPGHPGRGKVERAGHLCKVVRRPHRLRPSDPGPRRGPAHLPADLPAAAHRQSAAECGRLHWAGRPGAAAVVSVRHPDRLRIPVRRAVLQPALAHFVPPAEQVGGRHRRVGRRHRHRRQRHRGQRHRPLPPGLRSPQRHQDLRRFPGRKGGGRHRHPHPGVGLRPGQDLPRPAAGSGRHLSPGVQLLLL